MVLLNKVLKCESTAELNHLISVNREEFADFFIHTDYTNLVEQRALIAELSTKREIIGNLDFASLINVAFVNNILTLAIILGDRFLFQIFYRLITVCAIDNSAIINAASKFLIGIADFNRFRFVLSEMMPLLRKAYLEESDDGRDVEFVLSSYFIQGIEDFGDFYGDGVNEIAKDIHMWCSKKDYCFLRTELTDFMLGVSLSEAQLAVKEIRDFRMRYQSRDANSPGKYKFSTHSSIVETKYWDVASRSPADLVSVNKRIFADFHTKEDIYYSLHRGVRVLDSEEQLICYIAAYGDMHFSKLDEAIKFLPVIGREHSIFDWGCGQGLASFAYLHKRLKGKYSLMVQKVVLIDPSVIALQRASHYLSVFGVETQVVNSDFDHIGSTTFSESGVSLHLFSNILDVESFSLKSFMKYLTSNFSGENYFLITSPYISDSKTARIDTFVSHFESMKEFKLIYSVNFKKGHWGKNWSMVIRIFKVVLNE